MLPVNFCLDYDGGVLLCTSAASELVRAIDGAVVAFEADEVHAVAHWGWSVVVTGSASVVTDPAEHERLSRTGPPSWVPARRAVQFGSPLVQDERRTQGGRPTHARAASGGRRWW